jgi:predicted phage tail protein
VDTERYVDVGLVYNAFDPTNVVREQLVYQEGKTLKHYIEGLPDTCDWRIGVNTIPVEETDYDKIVLKPDDLITLVVVPRGGETGKSILRLVALLAVMAVAYFALGPGGLGLTGMAFTVAFGATVAVGAFLINLAIPPTALKMKGKDDAQTYGYDGAKNTAKEGIAVPVVYGQFRVAGNYIDVFTENVGDDQYLYGRCIVSDGEIDSIVGTPELNQQPITDFKNIEWGYTNGTLTDPINTRFNQAKAQFFREDKLSTTYTEYTTTGPVDAFEIDFIFPSGLANINKKDGTKSNFSTTVEIQYAPYGTTNWTNPGSTGGATSPSTPFTGPSPTGTDFGVTVKGIDSSSGSLNNTANYSVEYSPAGAGTWTTLQTFSDQSTSYTTKRNFSTGDTAYARYDNLLSDVGSNTYETNFPYRTVQATLPEGSYDFRVSGDGQIVQTVVGTADVAPASLGASGSTSVTYTDRRTVAIRKTYKSPTLPHARYHIRFRRTVAEDLSHPDHISELHCTSVAEIQHSKVSMQSLATAWYVAKMTDQLSGIPNINWVVKGVKVDIYDANGVVTATQWSDNPADIVLDMLISSRRGPLRDKIAIDFPAYVAWREHCEAEGLKFNGVFDSMTTLWDSLQQVYRVGRASPVRVGTKLSVAVDKPTQPVMLFGPGNIYRESFQIHYLAMQDRATEFEVTYYDKDDKSKEHTIRIADPDIAQSGQIPKTAQYTLFGIDNFEQAQKEVWYQLYNNRLARRIVTFDAPVESIGLSLGDVALIQHDMVDWGTSGRVKNAVSTSQVTLDKEVEIESGKSYSLLVIHDKVERFTSSLTHVTGNTYTLASMSATTFTEDKIKRIRTNTGDEAAVEFYEYMGASSATVVLDRPVTGTSASLWDVDVIEERAVSTGASVTQTINVSTPFSVAPNTYSNYMFGESTSVRRPFRLRSITGDGFERRTLTFAEYNEFVYSPPETPIPAPTAKPPTYPNHVTGLALVLEPIRTGTTATGVLSWQVGDILHYGGVDVYIATNGGDFVFYNTVMNTTTMMMQLQEGSTVDIKVVAFNDRGLRANINTAPVLHQGIDTVASSLVEPTDLTWTLYRIDYMASGAISWSRADATLGNISPNTRVQIQFEGTTEWVDQGQTYETILEVANIPAGNHTVRIRTENTTGQISDWVTQTFAVTAPVVVAPTFLTDGSAMDHDLNTDGSCNLNIEWQWAGAEDDVDGFQVISYQGATNAEYLLGTSASLETINTVTPDKRIFWYYGVPCDKWYTIYVRAYKFVHPSFAPDGIIYSDAHKPALAGENPYQPSANVAFGGDVTGTIGGVPVEDIIGSALDTDPPLIPSGLILSSALEDNPDGTQWVKLLAEWTPNTEADLASYVIAIKEDASDYIEFTVTKSVSSFYWSVLPNTSYTAKIKAVDVSQNSSGYSAPVSHTTLADDVPPAAPTSLAAISSIRNVFLSWTNPPDADVSKIKIYENTVNDSSTATNIATVISTPGSQGRFTRSGLNTGDLRWYWIKAVDSSGNVSAFSTGVSVTTAQVGTGDIAAFSVTAELIAAGTITADKLAAGTITGDLFQTGTSLPGSIEIGTTGVTIQTLLDQASDPATTINAHTTLIQPGLILINGTTTLSDWRNGSDLTKIEGGSIAANTISANKLTIGLRGIDLAGLEFQANVPTANRLAWSSGTVTYINDLGVPATVTIATGHADWTGSILYIYWIKGGTTLNATTTPATAYAANNLVLATYSGGTDLVANYGRTIIDGSHIITGTIDANRIKAGTVLADTVLIGSSGPIIGDIAAWAHSTDSTYIDGGKIFANSITASQLTTGTLISASSQLGDATVTTLKIAGQSIISPVVTEGSDVSLLSSSSSDVLTTANITVGDAVDGKALITIYGWADISTQIDAGAALELYVSTDGGSTYDLKKTIKVGVRTAGASTYSYVPFSASFTVSSVQTVRVQMKGRQIMLPGQNAYRTVIVRDPTIVVQGAAR